MKLLGVRCQFQGRKRALSDRLKHGERCYTGIGTRSDNRAVLVLAIVVHSGSYVKWRTRHLTMQGSESASGVVRGKFLRRCSPDRQTSYVCTSLVSTGWLTFSDQRMYPQFNCLLVSIIHLRIGIAGLGNNAADWVCIRRVGTDSCRKPLYMKCSLVCMPAISRFLLACRSCLSTKRGKFPGSLGATLSAADCSIHD